MAGWIREGISATELVRNFSQVVDEVRMTGKTVEITKGARAIAQLVPPAKNGLPLSQLAAFFEAMPKLENESLFNDDLQKVREAATLPESVWE